MSDAATLPTQEIDPQVAGARVARMYARHGRTLYGLCRMLLRDPHDAEDALQSTFLSAHRALVRGGAPRDEAAWLVTIARNECRGRIRTRMETPVHGDVREIEVLPDPAPTPEERLRDEGVQKALASLPESQREAVVLHDVLGLRSREVGRALGMSVPAVEALLFRARRQLRVRLRPTGALVLPAAVGYSLAQAIPGFVAPAAAGIAGATGSAAGAGILTKLAGAPAAAKVAAGVAAAATAGSVAAVEVTREPADTSRPVPAQVERPAGAAPVSGTSPSPAAARTEPLPAPTGPGPSSGARGEGSGSRREADEHAEDGRSTVEPKREDDTRSARTGDGGGDHEQGAPAKGDDSDDDGATRGSGGDDRVVTGDDDADGSGHGKGSAAEPDDVEGRSGAASGDDGSGTDDGKADDPESSGSDGGEQGDDGSGSSGSGDGGTDDEPESTES